jgi:hypothetical protein
VKCLICVPLWTNIRYATDTEAKVNALDRLNQFAELPPEASCFDTGSGLMDSSFTQNKVYWCVVCYVVVVVFVFSVFERRCIAQIGIFSTLLWTSKRSFITNYFDHILTMTWVC